MSVTKKPRLDVEISYPGKPEIRWSTRGGAEPSKVRIPRSLYYKMAL
jgi:hypothetical protein